MGHGGYGAAPGYGAGLGHGVGLGHGAILGHGSLIGHDNDYSHGAINGNALKLASLALSLPSAGAPIPATIAYPNHATTSYSAPALIAPSLGGHGLGAVEPATASTAAAAASNVAANAPRTAYAPVSAHGSGSHY